MRKWSYNTVRRLAGRGHFDYAPFPGASPVRLLIKVSVMSPNQKVLRFHYNGKWNYSAIRRARRVYNSLDPVSRWSEMYEYCQTGLLYSGTLIEGIYSDLRMRIFYLKDMAGMITRGRTSPHIAVPTTVVRCGKRYFLSMEPDPTTPKEELELRRACLRNFRRLEGGLYV